MSSVTYAQFKKELSQSNCALCELSKGRTHIVVDRGNPLASVLIVGEAPGENEDRQAKAFVGRGGRLFDQMMREVDFDTNAQSLIVNVVKCRPPKNRPPKPEEVNACSPFLKKQIEMVKPKIMLLLGATALRHLIPEKKNFKMSEEVGRFFESAKYVGVRVMVLYHPAFILRDPRKKPLMIEHLKIFKAFLETL